MDMLCFSCQGVASSTILQGGLTLVLVGPNIKGWSLISILISSHFFMNNSRSWSILNWNIRGLNAENKWLALKQKIEESADGIVCLQETKREVFDLTYINNFCPHRFNKFE